jgi:hypothetical protein
VRLASQRQLEDAGPKAIICSESINHSLFIFKSLP